MIRLRHLTACFASAATPHGSLARAATTTATTSFSFSTSAGTMAAAAAAAVAAAPSQGELKKQVGYKAVDDFVRSGMKIGLGTGSTAYFAVERVGQLLASGELTDIIAIPTSVRTKEQAESLKIPLATLDTVSALDVAIDGADSVDLSMNLVKGGGGALLREKMVEACAKTFVVIVDESKLCDGLGPHFPIPVEIVPFCHEHTIRLVLRRGSAANNKPDGEEVAVTDNGNYIVDLHFERPLTDAHATAAEILQVIGVVEHGLFCGMASCTIVAGSDGVRELSPPKKPRAD